MRYYTKRSLPTTPHTCVMTKCIYMREGEGACQDPRNNRGNFDALCHLVRPREVLGWIKPVSLDDIQEHPSRLGDPQR
jgi:hypothetical protein